MYQVISQDLCGANDCACLCSGGNCKVDGGDGLAALVCLGTLGAYVS